MENIDRFILLTDLSARIMYHQMCTITLHNGEQYQAELTDGIFNQLLHGHIAEIKPHLVPYNKMPKDLNDQIFNTMCDKEKHITTRLSMITNLLHKHHIDYNGLIFKNLAIEVPYSAPQYKK